jgi:NitT/TauT family transport system ATP-binding protein
MAVSIDAVNFKYEADRKAVHRSVLENVNLNISAGSFVSLVGPSGCGKTTLLRLIAGLLAPSSGLIRIGDDAPGVALKRRAFGFVFQRSTLLPWYTVLENIALADKVAGSHVDLKRASAYAARMGLSGFEHYYPSQLSGGMQSRVAIARALIYEPNILLLDEPFGDLDEITRAQLQLHLITAWQTSGCTIILITHSVSEALLLSDEIIVMGHAPHSVIAKLQPDFPNRLPGCVSVPPFHLMRERITSLLEPNLNQQGVR